MAIENGVQNAELGYILDPAFQIENINGKPAVGGHIEIFEAGTDNKYISYQNFDGAQNPFKIPLGSDGRAVILGDPSLSYDVYAYDSYNNLMFSRLNVQCNVPGNISIKGADTRINNTDGTLDISLRTLGNNVRQYTINTHNKVLDVQSPLYFVENSETATVIGFDQSGNYIQKDYLADFVTSSISGKADTTAVDDEFTNVHNDITAISSIVSSLPTFSDVESGDDAVKNWVTNQDYATRNEVSVYTKRTDFDAAVESINSNKLDVSAYRAQSGDFLQSADLADYYKKTETSSRNELNAAFDNKLDESESANYYPMTSNPSGFLTEHQSLAALMSASKLEYTLGGKISGYDGSAFAGGEGGSYTEGDYIDIDGDIISVTGLQPSGDYLSATESANYYPMTGNPSGFLTEHQSLDGYLNESGFEYDGDKISAYNGSAFIGQGGGAGNEFTLSAGHGLAIEDYPELSASVISVTGSDVPEGVLVQSGLEYNSTMISGYSGSAFNDANLTDFVNTNSAAWGGSALPISAGPGIDVQLVDDKLVFSAIPNETVLFDVSTGSTAITLSELATNFDSLKITYNSNEATTAVPEIREFPSTATTLNLFQRFVKNSNDFVIDDVQRYNTNDFINYTTTTAAGSHAWYSMPFTYAGASQGSVVSVTKVIGINRISGAN